MSAFPRGCVKTLEAVVGAQQQNRRLSLSKISDAREACGLNQPCAWMTHRRIFTQPPPEADQSPSPGDQMQTSGPWLPASPNNHSPVLSSVHSGTPAESGAPRTVPCCITTSAYS